MNRLSNIKMALVCACSILLCWNANGQITYVSEDGTGDGASWENATADLRAVLETATSGDEIWVAQGTYKPSDCTNCHTADKNISFVLNEGVSLYGGFSGNETTLSQRDPAKYPSILDGDIGVVGDQGDNSYTILQIGVVSDALVDGFTFQNGNSNEGISDQLGPKNSGGAIHIKSNGAGNFSAPKIRNCNFFNNRADSFGGAINVYGGFEGHGKATIENCRFQGNFAPKKGGAIYQYGAFSGAVDGFIIDCFFSQNASTEGGALFVASSENGLANLTVTGSQFENNWSVTSGGAVFNSATGGQNTSSYEDCLFYNNSGKLGGGMYNDAQFGGVCDLTFTHCLFRANTSDQGGAGIYNNAYQGASNSNYYNSTFELNYTQQSGAAVYNNGVEGICNGVFDRCYFLENVVEMYGGAMYNFGKTGDATPVLVNCLFRRNKADSGGVIYNFGGSNGNSNPTIQNCTFTLNEARVGPCIYNQASDPTGTVKPLVSNCIFWDNESYTGFGLVFQNGFAEPTIEYSLIPFDDCVPLNTDDDSNVICGDGLLFNVDPEFTDEQNLNFRPLGTSPIVDQGTLPVAMESEIDLDGFPRINNGVLDLGAYEFGPISVPEIITQSVSGVYCIGETIILEVNAIGTGAVNYQWSKDGVTLNGEINNILKIESLSALDAGQYQCRVFQNGLEAFSDVIDIALQQPNETTVELNPTATEFCAGENEIEVSLEISNGGYFPSISWILNGSEISTEFSPLQLTVQDGDELKASYEALQICFSEDSILTETLLFSEQTVVVPSIEISLDQDIYCATAEVVINSNLENAGDDGSVNWYKNGALALSNSAQFSSTDLSDGDEIYAELISSISCVSEPIVNSNTETVSILPITFPSVSINDNNDSLCINEALTFEAMIANAGMTPQLVWLVDGVEQAQAGNVFGYTFEDSGSHTLSVNVSSSDECPDQEIVTSSLNLDLLDCMPNATGYIQAEQFKLWPNPVFNNLTLEWAVGIPLPDEVDFDIKTIDGHQVGRSNIEISRSNSQWNLNVENLNSGCYILEIKSKNQHYSKRFVVLK